MWLAKIACADYYCIWHSCPKSKLIYLRFWKWHFVPITFTQTSRQCKGTFGSPSTHSTEMIPLFIFLEYAWHEKIINYGLFHLSHHVIICNKIDLAQIDLSLRFDPGHDLRAGPSDIFSFNSVILKWINQTQTITFALYLVIYSLIIRSEYITYYKWSTKSTKSR